MPRLAWFVIVFFSTTLPFVGALWLLDKLKLPGRRPLSVRYYRMLCRRLRLRIHVVGEPMHGKPTLTRVYRWTRSTAQHRTTTSPSGTIGPPDPSRLTGWSKRSRRLAAYL